MRVLQGFERVCTPLFTMWVWKCVSPVWVCVCPSSRRQFLKCSPSDIGWLLYNLTGLCTEAGCAMSHWLHISLVCCCADPYIGGGATWRPPIDSCSPVKLPSGPEWRTPHLSSGPGPNLFQREVMKKLIISNEELAIEAGRKDRQHCSEESKRAGKPRCQRGFIGDPEVFLIGLDPRTGRV